MSEFKEGDALRVREAIEATTDHLGSLRELRLDLIRELRDAGKTYSEIGDAVGLDQARVYRLLNN